jgi:Potential Queuosine, Q, salvage protein family
MADATLSNPVLASASYISDNSIDVAIDPTSTKEAAANLYHQIQLRNYSTQSWSAHELHPKPEGGEQTLAMIFTIDLLNFSFWSDGKAGGGVGGDGGGEPFGAEYRGKMWTGYWSLVACLQRALDEGRSPVSIHFFCQCRRT